MPERSIAAVLLAISLAVAGEQSALVQRANSAYGEARFEEAVALYRQALAAGSSSADVRIFLGAALLGLNRTDEALTEARRALEANPSAWRAHTLLGRIYAAQRKWELARSEFAKAGAMNPTDRETPYFAGRALYESGDVEAAARQFQHAIRLGAVASRVYENLGRCWEELNENEKAEDAYRGAVKAPNAAPGAYYHYGLFLYKQGRVGESVALLRRSLEQAPGDLDARLALARALLRAGEARQARDILTAPGTPSDCRVHVLLLRIYSATNSEDSITGELKALEACAAR